jgi:hypothetical protein
MEKHVSTQMLLGHVVTPGPTPNAAYLLISPKGTVIKLCRNVHNPHMLFPINTKTQKCVLVKGKFWFTDEGGVLKPA